MTRLHSSAVLPVLYLASLLSYVDRIIFSLALQPIKLQFGFSDSQLGLLAGLAFGVSYAAFSPIAGWFADRRSRKGVLLFAVLVWSGATLATAFATSFASMFAARALVGMGEAAVMPLAVSMLGDTRDPALRARAFGLFLSASALGTAVGMVFGGAVLATITRWGGIELPLLGMLLPWQSLFVVASAMGVLFVAVVSIILRDPPRSTASGHVAAGDEGVWRFVRANPMIIFTLYIGLSLVQMATVTNLVWVVPMFSRLHGLTPGSAALMVGSTAGVAMTIGCFVSGRLMSQLRRRGDGAASMTLCFASGSLFAFFMLVGLFAENVRLSLAFITIGMFLSYIPTICALSVMGESLPAPIRARLAGFNTMSNALICNSLGSLLVGIFGDRLFSGNASTAHALALVIMIGLISGGIVILTGMPAYRRRMRLLATEGDA